MKNIFFIFLICLNTVLFSQDITFFKKEGHNGRKSIANCNSYYYISSFYYPSFSANNSSETIAVLYKTDLNGITIDSIAFFEPHNYILIYDIKVYNDTIHILLSKGADEFGNLDIYYVTLSNDLEILDYNFLRNEPALLSLFIDKNKHGNFIINGFSWNYWTGMGKSFLIEHDGTNIINEVYLFEDKPHILIWGFTEDVINNRYIAVVQGSYIAEQTVALVLIDYSLNIMDYFDIPGHMSGFSDPLILNNQLYISGKAYILNYNGNYGYPGGRYYGIVKVDENFITTDSLYIHYGFNNTSSSSDITGAICSNNEYIYIAGRVETSEYYNYMEVTKVDSLLNPIWTRRIGGIIPYGVGSIFKSHDGGCLVAVLLSGFVAIYKFDSDGNLVSNFELPMHATNLNIYPNPFTSSINGNLPEQGIANITLVNTMGKVLITEQVQGSTFSINTQNLPAGFYFLKLQQGEKMYNYKLVKE